MFFWRVYLKRGDKENIVRSRYNIESIEEALKEVMDVYDCINLVFKDLGIDVIVDFEVAPQEKNIELPKMDEG